MSVGERSLFVISPEWAYGESGIEPVYASPPTRPARKHRTHSRHPLLVSRPALLLCSTWSSSKCNPLLGPALLHLLATDKLYSAASILASNVAPFRSLLLPTAPHGTDIMNTSHCSKSQ
jgi:hypothetical protein